MILKFLISGPCYAQSHVFSTPHFLHIFSTFSTHFLHIFSTFSTHFLHIFSTFSPHFLMTFFCSPRFFHTCKNALKPINIYHILHPPYPRILFRSQHGGKIFGNSQELAKIKIIGRMYPPGICSPADTYPPAGLNTVKIEPLTKTIGTFPDSHDEARDFRISRDVPELSKKPLHPQTGKVKFQKDVEVKILSIVFVYRSKFCLNFFHVTSMTELDEYIFVTRFVQSVH